ncbi:hypothetical protein TNCV_4420851 [Trichonephila clavipes]|nr:hypothetical protein TNCV_4420851 [Trichonephila clavipes]
MADNRCGWFIVHFKKKNNKSFFLPEEAGTRRRDGEGRQIVIKGAMLQRDKQRQQLTYKLYPICYRTLHDSENSKYQELYDITSNYPVLYFV